MQNKMSLFDMSGLELVKKKYYSADKVSELMKEEIAAGGALDMDTRVISTITSHPAGYIDKDKEKIVGLQTEKPLKRALMPAGGIRMAVKGEGG